MPSTLHEALVMLFRESPRLAPMLVARALGFELPEDADIQVTAAEFAELDPPEYRADVVLRVPDEIDQDRDRQDRDWQDRDRQDRDRQDRDRATREAFIVEVQLEVDPVKRYTWPQYVTAARTRFRCRATLVVVAVDERVARWCAQPIELDRAGNVFRPVVIGPGDIPVVTDEAQARTWPELAVLSAIAHGHEPGSEAIGVAALAACDQLDNPQAGLYADLVYANLNEIARAALEALMQQHKYTYQSDFARKYVAQGLEQGYRALLGALLQQRFGELPAEVQARLDAADADTLSAWGRRVLTAATLADVFVPEPA